MFRQFEIHIKCQRFDSVIHDHARLIFLVLHDDIHLLLEQRLLLLKISLQIVIGKCPFDGLRGALCPIGSAFILYIVLTPSFNTFSSSVTVSSS